MQYKLIVLLSFFVLLGKEQTFAQAKIGPKMTFEKTSFFFGTKNEGDIVEHNFKFKNTGDAPLVITEVERACGCTDPEFSKEPILPGQEGFIKVTFYSNGRTGVIRKTMKIKSNIKSEDVPMLFIRGEVIPRDAERKKK